MLSPAGKWIWALSLQASKKSQGSAIAVDAKGDIYTAGGYEGSMKLGGTTPLPTAMGCCDVYTAKLSSTAVWQWASAARGAFAGAPAVGAAMVPDGSGGAVVYGAVDSGKTTFGSHPVTSQGSGDLFVARLDKTGKWLWATGAGGGNRDHSYNSSALLDKSGTIYVAGSFRGSAKFGTTQLTGATGTNPFVASISSSGKWLWATAPAGTTGGDFYDLAWGPSGELLAVGTKGPAAYLARFSAAGTYQASTQMGSASGSSAYTVGVDSKGNVIVGGVFKTNLILKSTTLPSKGDFDVFLWKAGQGVP